MQDLIYNLGKERVQNKEITQSRHIIDLNITQHNSKEELIELTKLKLNQLYQIDLDSYRTEIIERDNPTNFYLNWHIDDCAVYKHDTTNNKYHNEPLNDKYSLFHLKGDILLPIL